MDGLFRIGNMQVSGTIAKTEQNKIHHKAVITLLQAQYVTSELIMSKENKKSASNHILT